MMELINSIPHTMISFVLVAVFSLLVGLSQRRLHGGDINSEKRTFGTDRTFTFIGILGFVLYIISPQNLAVYLGGGIILAVFLAINYYISFWKYEDQGITTIIIAMITYTFGPLVMTQPLWMVLLILVVVLIFTELKESFYEISRKFDREEFLTLGKFLIIAGVILPIVPDEPIVKELTLTPYKIWLAVVVVSSISYLSYLLKKFVFKQGSIILSGILGGMYSSTATSIILARKSRNDESARNQYVAAIIFATAMMYLRILILILIFNMDLFILVYPYFIALFVFSGLVGTGILFYRNKKTGSTDTELTGDKNPLEFKVALLFTALYVAFTFITHLVLKNFGTVGLNILSYIVGLTDIDPFLINLFQGKYSVGTTLVALATLQAIISNNVLKMIYSSFFSSRKNRILIIPGFLLVIVFNIVLVLVL